MNHMNERAQQMTTAEPRTTARRSYQTPKVTPLGEWTVLTLANSLPVPTSFPLFGK